jgi:hypothetical protein
VLILVHSIELQETRSNAFGGTISPYMSWQIDEAALTAISYIYTLPPT